MKLIPAATGPKRKRGHQMKKDVVFLQIGVVAFAMVVVIAVTAWATGRSSDITVNSLLVVISLMSYVFAALGEDQTCRGITMATLAGSLAGLMRAMLMK